MPDTWYNALVLGSSERFCGCDSLLSALLLPLVKWFLFPGAAPGIYVLTCTASGYDTAVLAGVQVYPLVTTNVMHTATDVPRVLFPGNW